MVRFERRKALQQALEDIARYRHLLDLPTFLANRDTQRMVTQALVVAIQAATDEAMAEAHERGLTGGDHHRGAFLTLGQAGLITPDLAVRLGDLAAFRKVLGQFHPDLDMRRVYATLPEVSDLEAFLGWLEGA